MTLKIPLFLLKACLITLVCFFVLKSCQERSEVKRVQRYIEGLPEILNVEKLIYIAESPWYDAIGPGGNEGGIRVFEMPDEVVNKITDDVNFLEDESFRTTSDLSPLKTEWIKTPNKPNRFMQNGFDLVDCFENQCDSISNYIQYYMMVDLDPEIIAAIDNAMQSDGSFSIGYSNGLLILMPKEKWIVYAFSG